MAAVKLDENVPDSVGTILRNTGHDVALAAFALDHQRVAVVQQLIEDRGGKHLVAEDAAPLHDELVRRDQEARALVLSGDGTERRAFAETAIAHAGLAQIPSERVINCWPSTSCWSGRKPCAAD